MEQVGAQSAVGGVGCHVVPVKVGSIEGPGVVHVGAQSIVGRVGCHVVLVAVNEKLEVKLSKSFETISIHVLSTLTVE